jgi:hypothetical protein
VEALAKVFMAAYEWTSRLIAPLGGFQTILVAISMLLGAGLIGAFGAATGAVLRFTASLLLANALPAIMAIGFGVLLAALLLVIQDLNQTDSLIKKVWEDGPIRPEDSAMVTGLKMVRDLLRDINEMFKTTIDFWDKQIQRAEKIVDILTTDEDKARVEYENRNPGVASRMASWRAEQERRRLEQQYTGLPGMMNTAADYWRSAGSSFDVGSLQMPNMGSLAAGMTPGGGTFAGMPPEIKIDITQNFSGNVDPAEVKAATSEGISEAMRDEAWFKVYDFARREHFK